MELMTLIQKQMLKYFTIRLKWKTGFPADNHHLMIVSFHKFI